MFWSGIVKSFKNRILSIDLNSTIIRQLETAGDRLGELTKLETSAAEEVFFFHDPESTGKVHLSQLCSMLRMLGQNPTMNELNFMEYELAWLNAVNSKENTDHINFNGFLRLLLLNAKTREQMETEYLENFKRFDPDGVGYVHLDDLRKMVRPLSTDLTQDEIYALFKNMDLWKNGKVRYKELIRYMVKDNVFFERRL